MAAPDDAPTVCLAYGDQGHSLGRWHVPGHHSEPLRGNGGRGPFAAFVLRPDHANGVITLQHAVSGGWVCVTPERAGCSAAGPDADPSCLLRLRGEPPCALEAACSPGACLVVGPPPGLLMGVTRPGGAPGAPPPTLFTVVPLPLSARAARAAAAASAAPAPPPALPPAAWPPPAFHLSPADRAAFDAHGYLVLKGALPLAAVLAARRQMMSFVGKLAYPQHCAHDPAPFNDKGEPDFFSSHPSYTGLYSHTAVAGFANALLCGHAPRGCGGAQQAPRFPRPVPRECAAAPLTGRLAVPAAPPGPPPQQQPSALSPSVAAALPLLPPLPGEPRPGDSPGDWHLDGCERDPPRPFSFSLLVCLQLSDATAPGERDDGAFTVFPGTHHALALAIAEHRRRGGPHPRLTGGSPADGGARPLLASRPLALRLAPGDVAFAHPLLAHRAGPNFTSEVRYAAFLRLTSARQDEALREGMLASGDCMAVYRPA